MTSPASSTGRLSGKVALITGATSGIGAATARLFVAEGARVLVTGRNEERGAAISAELGENAVFHRADVTSEADIASAITACTEHFGRMDCLFNNAGEIVSGDLLTITGEEFDHGMRVLVASVMFGMKHAAPALRDGGGGSIINNSSIAGLRHSQGGYLYAAAKAAVAHITRLAGVDLGPDGIRVNSIAPGAIATPIFWGGLTATDHDDAAERERKLNKLERNLAAATPLPRAGQPEDIAEAALFLASDAGSFINSHEIVVDGGRIWQYNEASPRG